MDIEQKKYSLRDYKSKQPKEHKRIPVPKKVLEKGRSVQFMIAGVVLMAFPTVELYRRLVLGTERKMQTGEINKDKSIRIFSEEEKIARDKNTWFVWLFGDK